MPTKPMPVGTETTEQKDYAPSEAEIETARQTFLKNSDGSQVDFSKFEKSEQNQEEDPQKEDSIEEKPQKNQEEKTEQPEYSGIELAAMKQGWKPETQFNGDKSKWRDARSWVDRAELFERIDRQNQYIQRMEEQQKEMVGFIKSRYEQENNNEIETLKKHRVEAIKRGDVEEVEKIEGRMGELSKSSNPSIKKEPENPQNNITPEQKAVVDNFVQQNNDWFNDKTDQNKQMVKEFIIREQILSKMNPDMSLQDRLEDSKKYVNNLYTIEKKPNVQPAEGKSRGIGQRTDEAPDFNSLPSRTKQIIDYYVSSYRQKIKNMRTNVKPRTREYYIREMIKTKAIDKYGSLIDR